MYTDLNEITASMAGFGAGIVIFFLVLIFAFLIMYFLAYIFESLAFYRFMENRKLDNAFLAWIPIVRSYTVGKVYDDINEKQGKKTHFSIILLILNCIIWLSYFLPISGLDIIIRIFSGLAFIILELICFNLIFKKYTPNNSSYFVLTVIFLIIQIVPFIPGICLLKASKNEPVSETKD